MDARVRKIWLLWWTGWDHAPSLIKECAASWIEVNPSWSVELLDRTTVDATVNISLPAAQWAWMKQHRQAAASDVARLALMAQRGGVYADATEYCFQPCDAWVNRLLRRSGFAPYQIAFGREPRLPGCLLSEDPPILSNSTRGSGRTTKQARMLALVRQLLDVEEPLREC